MEKLTKECVLQSAARLEQESQDAVMRDIPQFFEAEIVTRFAGAAPQKKELYPLVFNMVPGRVSGILPQRSPVRWECSMCSGWSLSS